MNRWEIADSLYVYKEKNWIQNDAMRVVLNQLQKHVQPFFFRKARGISRKKHIKTAIIDNLSESILPVEWGYHVKMFLDVAV